MAERGNTSSDMQFRARGLGIYKLDFADVLVRPFLFLVFLYFVLLSFDVLNVSFLIFKVKLTNLASFILLIFGIFLHKDISVPRNFAWIAVAALFSMAVSVINCCNLISCAGLILFYFFNFIFYFLLSFNLFRWIAPDILLRLYFSSFFCVGIYALCQVVFSLAGFILPGVTQYIFALARGQAFAYEPSYYALYMTSFAIFCTAKFMLQPAEKRNVNEVIWSNLFLLVSTSTGCFYSYLLFILFFCSFIYFGFVPGFKGSVFLVLFKYFSVIFAILLAVWFVYPDLINHGFLKFFYFDPSDHISFKSRWAGIVNYWVVFLRHPWFGVGLGAGPFYLFQISSDEHGNVYDADIYNSFAPTNVTLEILSGLGIFGFIVFVWFFAALCFTFWKAIRIRGLSEADRTNLVAFALSLCVMFAALQFNQSIMRAYMWVHVGIFVGYVQYLFRSKSLLKLASVH